MICDGSPAGLGEHAGHHVKAQAQKPVCRRKTLLNYGEAKKYAVRCLGDGRVNDGASGRSPAGAAASGVSRRAVLAGLGVISAAVGTLAAPAIVRAGRSVTFGLTPVFLDSDLELLDLLTRYFTDRLGQSVTLVKRRTYQEISALLLSGQLDAAWICGFPYVQYRDRLSLMAVPIYRNRPLYQSYLIVGKDREAAGFGDLRGDIHAFSDPNSNSGYLVSRHLLWEMKERPETYFSRTIFTYGHRNVIRAVSSGLAGSGSVDGYVWDVMAEREPDLVAGSKVIRKSKLLGFPPIACGIQNQGRKEIAALTQALLEMASDPSGGRALSMLKLDGFMRTRPSLFDDIAAMYADVSAS